MPNDGSLASKTEQWIADQVAALTQFADGTVEVYPGSTHPDGQQVIDEMLANRSPYCTVLFSGDVPIPLEEGQSAYEPTYELYVAIQNERQGSARKGDGTTPGTNLIRDLLRNALHDKYPNQTANGFYTDRTEFRGARIAFQRADAFVMLATCVVRESPAA
ncbi:MAG: hypothetical protein AABZ12_03600 [Planctomycetota bacterium]